MKVQSLADADAAAKRGAEFVAAEARRAPEIGKTLARFLGAAAVETVGQHHRVHRARRGAGNAFDGEAPVVQQMIEHAPGKGAMCTAALQAQANELFRLRVNSF